MSEYLLPGRKAPLQKIDCLQSNFIREILIHPHELQERNRELGRLISRDYANTIPVVIILSNGAIIFASDLVREISIPLHLDVLPVHSYSGKQATHSPKYRTCLKLDIANKDVLIIDDILDTGATLEATVSYLQGYSPRTVKTCVLLKKMLAQRSCGLEPDYVGFDVDDTFVVGYGLDHNEFYRNLPHIASLQTD